MNLALVKNTPEAIIQSDNFKVFDVSTRCRLDVLNCAERKIRQMGYRVIWTRIAGQRPQIAIQRDELSTKLLLDQMTEKHIRDKDGYKTISGLFHGVDLTWIEPQ